MVHQADSKSVAPQGVESSILSPSARVVHCKKESYDVYIGRPSKWGNPFSHKEGTKAEFKVYSRAEAISKHREWILTQPELLADLGELVGKVLGCWCHPKSCHGETLIDLVDEKNMVGWQSQVDCARLLIE